MIGAFRAFAHRDFRLFWSGQLVSLVGTWMGSVAQSWLVLELTNSALLLGVVAMLQFSPMLFLSVFAGALTDRLPKRRLIIASQTVLALQALLLAVLVAAGAVCYWHVAVLAGVYGIANTIDMPARQSFVIEMVGRGDMRSAIALNSAMFNSARVIGPAVAGVLIARWGMAPAFIVNAASFAAVLGALLAVRAEGLPRARRGQSLRAEIAEGVRYATRTPRVALPLALVAVVGLCVFNYNVFVPLMARDVLHEGAGGFGLLMATLGAGSVAGALTLAAVGDDRPSAGILVASAAALSATTLGLAAAHRFWTAAAVLFAMGFCGMLFMAGANTTLQLTVPDELRGRVMSLHTLVFAGATPFGSFAVGSISEAFGVSTGIRVAGIAALVGVSGIAAWWLMRRPYGAWT